MEFVPLVAFAALVKKLIDFLADLRNKDWNGAGTMLVAWVAGIAAVVLFGHSNWADQIHIGGLTLSTLNGFSQVIVGMTVASTAAFGHDALAAIDNSQSAMSPPLITTPTDAHRRANLTSA